MDHREYLDELREPTRSLAKTVPDVWKGFGALHSAAMADGELSATTKELIALAISVATGCQGCIGYHAKGAVRQGATRDQAAEAIGVALMMTGGPATTYGPQALQAFDQFTEEAEARAEG